MRSKFLALLGAVLVAPILTSSQTWVQIGPVRPQSDRTSAGVANPPARFTISVRELNIPRKARKLFDKGSRLLASGNAAASVPAFQQAVAEYRFFTEAYYELGRAQLTLGLGQDAADAFSKAIEVSDGRFALPYFALSLALCEQNNFAEGDTVAKAGLSLEPGSLVGQFSLSWAELGLGRNAFAEKTLREVLQRKADFREARLLLLEIHRRTNNLADLLEDIDAYLKLDDASPTSARLRILRENTVQSLAKAGNQSPLVANAQP